MTYTARNLTRGTQAALAGTVRERVDFVRRDHWIGYPVAERVLRQCTDLVDAVDNQRPPNLVITGSTNSGKTSILRRFEALHPPVNDPAESRAERPVVRFELPPVPDDQQLYNKLLTVLGAVRQRSDDRQSKFDRIVRLLRTIQTKVVVIDEMNNTAGMSPAAQLNLLKTIRSIGHEIQRPVILAGTPVVLSMLAREDQFQNRFETVELPLWGQNQDFLRLLLSLESFLPLPEPSRLSCPELAIFLLDQTDGLLGELCTLIRRAAVRAIETDAPCITLDLLRSLDWHSPRERNRLASRIGMGLSVPRD